MFYALVVGSFVRVYAIKVNFFLYDIFGLLKKLFILYDLLEHWAYHNIHVHIILYNTCAYYLTKMAPIGAIF